MEKGEKKKNYRKKFNKPQECKVEVKCGVEFIYCANYVKKILFIGLLPCTTIPSGLNAEYS